jgi:hypothetical protein
LLFAVKKSGPGGPTATPILAHNAWLASAVRILRWINALGLHGF